jgi:hypothetical protein
MYELVRLLLRSARPQTGLRNQQRPHIRNRQRQRQRVRGVTSTGFAPAARASFT